MVTTLPLPHDVRLAIARLKSLHDGDVGVAEVTACGGRAVEPLHALLLERERSGLYQTRCRAVDALAALGARDVLVDFLSTTREAKDPVERLGDEAVINAAALALARECEERVFDLLMTIIRRQPLPGVIGALGAFRRPEAIPFLVAALAEDDCRQAAASALMKLGGCARQALMVAAIQRRRTRSGESESSLRARRCALDLLVMIGIEAKAWPALRPLMREHDQKIKLLACKICLASAPAPEKRLAVRHLIDMLPNAGWMLGDEIENSLVDHFDIARDTIAAVLAAGEAATEDRTQNSTQMIIFRRVKRRGEARSQNHG
jgi:hypothetical protein